MRLARAGRPVAACRVTASLLTGSQALPVEDQQAAPMVAPRPCKRDILAVMVAGCVAFNNWENKTS